MRVLKYVTMHRAASGQRDEFRNRFLVIVIEGRRNTPRRANRLQANGIRAVCLNIKLQREYSGVLLVIALERGGEGGQAVAADFASTKWVNPLPLQQ